MIVLSNTDIRNISQRIHRKYCLQVFRHLMSAKSLIQINHEQNRLGNRPAHVHYVTDIYLQVNISKIVLGFQTSDMTYEWEMFEGDSADMCAGFFC